MTDDTRDRNRPFIEGGEPPETTGDGQADRSPNSGGADRTPAGTADSARRSSTGDHPTVATPDRDPGEDSNASSSTERSSSPNTESSGDRLEERLRAVERALTGTDDAVADLGDEASASAEREALSTRLDDLEARVEELEAATQAIRGYVGSIRSVNRAVERRADLALAKASENGNPAGGGRSEGGVPGETDIDAAVPADRRRGTGAKPPSGSTIDRPETDGEGADDSWRAGALDRLRESL